MLINLDTHVVINALKGLLNAKEQRLIATNQWGISAIVLWEISMFSRYKKIDIDLNDSELLSDLGKMTVWPIDLNVCRAIENLDFRSDPADEIIAATSITHHIPLLTRDKKILKSKVVPLA